MAPVCMKICTRQSDIPRAFYGENYDRIMKARDTTSTQRGALKRVPTLFPLQWINLSIDMFKIKCRKKFLVE